MQSCTCIDNIPKKDKEIPKDDIDDEDYESYDYEYRDYVEEGLIDLRIKGSGAQPKLKECTREQVRRCSIGQGSSPVETKEVCGDFDIHYSRGGQLQRFNNIPSADVCRARCIQHGECRYWTWRGSSRRKQCILVRNDNYKPVYQKGTISGTLDGACANLALSQLTKCECVNVNSRQENVDQEDLDLVGTGLIDVRISNNPAPTSVCSDGQGLRCYAEDAGPEVRVRVEAPAPRSNNDRIIFGK